MPPKRMKWTDEKEEELRRLVASGMSFKNIGIEMGCSRNSVIGKAHRMKLQIVNTERRPGNKRPVRSPVAPKKLLELPFRTVSVTEIEGRSEKVHGHKGPMEVKVEEVNWQHEWSRTMACWECFQPSSMCHWPVQEEPFQFCGAPRMLNNVTGKREPYCERHWRLSRSKRGEKKNARVYSEYGSSWKYR